MPATRLVLVVPAGQMGRHREEVPEVDRQGLPADKV